MPAAALHALLLYAERVAERKEEKRKRLAAFFAARRTLVGGTLRIVRIRERRRDFVNKWVRK